MRAKAYLSQLSNMRAELQRKKEIIESLDGILCSPSATEIKPDKVKKTNAENKQESLILKRLALEEDVQRLSVLTAELLLTMEKQINEMDNPVHSQLLYLRYLKYGHDISLDTIASDLHYEYNYVKVLHGEALQAFEQKYAGQFTEINKHHTK